MVQRETRERGREERERERKKGENFFSCADHFALVKICHVRQFNEKENGSTKGSNDTIVQISLDFLKKFRY